MRFVPIGASARWRAASGATEGAMDRSEPDVPAHISDTARQLRDLAEEADLQFLVHLLGVVILEAENARAGEAR